MEASTRPQLQPGATVVVTQQIPHRARTWVNEARGVVVSFEQRQTGSWFAHSKGDHLWLDRLTLRKPDGEITTLILDEYSRVEVQSAPTAESQALAAAATTAMAK